MQLIIVESPSKAKTIEKYLGGKYKVDASGGHVRDLPEKRMGVNVSKDFAPNYVIPADKKAVIKRLQEKVEKADKVYLATDPDREGEAISWHLKEVLGLGDDAQRIEFNEISEKAIRHALENPRTINYKLVDSQQARRILDRLVGYKLSPLLCKRIKNGLSAGRVQSVALRIIVDKEREIEAFVPSEYWLVSAEFNVNGKKFRALLVEKNGKKYKPTCEAEAKEAERITLSSAVTVKDVKTSVAKSPAPAPFTTSTMQQDASSKLNMSSPVCMQVAQHLYEGVETENGHVALVTYIRTDSVRVSKDAQNAARAYIAEKYGDGYVPEKPNFFKTKKNAQDAHEAIRPIDLSLTPEKAKTFLDRNHYNLYKLIYERFVASQMSAAEYGVTSVAVDAGEYTYKASGRTTLFKGFTAVYADFRVEAEDDKAMEEKGIGRPSTYATIISTLQKRKYTQKEGKCLKPAAVAFEMTDTLVKYFPDVMDVSFTANMEDRLDGIENCDRLEIDKVLESPKCKAIESLDVESSDEICDKCGAPMVYKNGRYGKFLACSNYPTCKNIKSLDQTVSTEKCEKCGGDMVVRTGKYGKYLQCVNCKETKSMTEKAGVCPVCGKPAQKMVSKKGKVFYGKTKKCSQKECGYVIKPEKEDKKTDK